MNGNKAQRHRDAEGGRRGPGMGTALLITFAALTVLSGAAIIWWGEALARFAFIVPVIFLFIAIGAFLLLLMHYAVTLRTINPTLPMGALGLPEGSIRAFLTIGLITLVAVFGTFIYFETGRPQPATVLSRTPVTTSEQLQEIRQSVGARFAVIPLYKDGGLASAEVVSAETDATRADIAKQLLTMITTVLTTVIGFYFGSRTDGVRAPTPAEGRAADALDETRRWTLDLDTRKEAQDRLLQAAEARLAGLPTPDAEAVRAKLGTLRTRTDSAWAALRESQQVVETPPQDVAVLLATRDKARQANDDVNAAARSLQRFVETGDAANLP